MFTAALFTMANIWNEPGCQLADEQIINKMWYSHTHTHTHTHTMDCYSAINKSEIPSFLAKWMKLENMMLREISQTQKDK
jgi:hypothetical protein